MLDPDGGRSTYTRDAANRLTLLLNPDGDRSSYTYDAAGRETLKRLANGTRTSRTSRTSCTYAAAGRTTAVAHLDSADTLFNSFDYGYDNTTNRTSVLEDSGDRTTYSYDTASQLIAEHRTGTGAYRNT